MQIQWKYEKIYEVDYLLEIMIFITANNLSLQIKIDKKINCYLLQNKLVKTFAEGSLKKYLNFIEQKLKSNKGGKGFLVGDKVTYCLSV